jgi:hypothetical protein
VLLAEHANAPALAQWSADTALHVAEHESAYPGVQAPSALLSEGHTTVHFDASPFTSRQANEGDGVKSSSAAYTAAPVMTRSSRTAPEKDSAPVAGFLPIMGAEALTV